MKKFKLFTAILIVITIAISAVACVTTPTLESITLKDGTIATQVVQDGVLDTSRIVVIAHYDDGTTQEIGYADSNLTVGSISTSEIGAQKLVITYKDKTLEVTVNVTAKPDPNASIVIEEVTLPDYIVEYKSNIREQAVENKQEEFVDREDGYYVGDDNEFIFKPVVNAEDEDGFAVSVNESILDIEFSVAVMEDDEYVAADTDDYLTTNGYGKISFKEEALNKQIKLTAKPFIVGYPENATESVSFEFTVVDGWNAYSVADLAMIEYDRHAIGGYTDEERINRNNAWNEYKTAHNLPTDKKVKAVILHDNFAVTKADIPSIFFYNDGDEDLSSSDADYERTKGSLRDFEDLYYRGLLPNETFDIIGNYFTVDASGLPYVTRESSKITDVGSVISHTTLIDIVGENAQIAQDQSIGKASMKNIFIMGNSQRSENLAASGGLIFQKAGDVDFTISNVISRKWFITFFPEKSNLYLTKYLVKDCKAYDSFNCFMYIAGVEDVTVENSEMIGAGGPVMIVDHVSPNNDGGFPSYVKITDSHLESNVSGEEGWFSLVNGTAFVPDLKLPDQLFRGYGKTYLRNIDGGTQLSSDAPSFFNLICIIKSGDAQGPSFDPITGSVAIDDNAPLNFGDGPQDDLASMLAKLHLEGLKGSGAPVFQSSAGGVGFTDGSVPMKKLNASTYQPENITDNTDALFQGDYLNIYFSAATQRGYMAAMMGYYDVE